MLAYLVIREDAKWTDVFRLVPGRTVTIGRAATNQIVVKDERCSRNHAEVFMTNGRWTLRDLGSRNGTLVGQHRVVGDYTLSPGEIVRIAKCQLAFVHDLSKAFADGKGVADDEADRDGAAAIAARSPSLTSDGLDDSDVHGGADAVVSDPSLDPTTITHRRGQTRYLRPRGDDATTPRASHAAARLCQVVFELAKQSDVAAVARQALEGLFEGTKVDGGAVLLAPRDTARPLEARDLRVVAWRTDVEPRYHRVSEFLANTVLSEGEAVLARNVADDSMLGSPDSKGEIHSTSVICAPIREVGRRVVGLIHLYSTRDDRQPDPDDLEFTLAVADNVALAIANLDRQMELADNLKRTESEIVQLRRRLAAESEIIGSSPLMDNVRKEMERAAASRATVLIRGESGVGKELVARAMHFSGPRKKGPFVCLNCAALTETLLESELFGHERGAFTGATDRKIGKFEAAHTGTLMLDEIGEMSPAIQAKFLRVLEGHPFERVGGNQSVKVDVRAIAATNRDLEKAVAEGKFRRDLYFRLRVIEIYVPPLRKRVDDIEELAVHFLEYFKAETGRRIAGFTPAALARMRHYRWPGNIREVKNAVERAVVLTQGDRIDADDLALTSLTTQSESGEAVAGPKAYEPISLADVERNHILATLKATGWNKTRAATILGIERSTLDRKIRRYQITRRY
ncbi:MAG: FHA domain-containing protein [Planctomycetes bacterium]|nr:FHA domain-containing protein [Planctomycetota bacterium]